MSDFMAKPIRRPALKSVLKQYCPPPPIEEEDESSEHKPSPGAPAGGTVGEKTALTNETDPFSLVGKAAGLKHQRSEIEAISPATVPGARPGLGTRDAGDIV